MDVIVTNADGGRDQKWLKVVERVKDDGATQEYCMFNLMLLRRLASDARILFNSGQFRTEDVRTIRVCGRKRSVGKERV